MQLGVSRGARVFVGGKDFQNPSTVFRNRAPQLATIVPIVADYDGRDHGGNLADVMGVLCSVV